MSTSTLIKYTSNSILLAYYLYIEAEDEFIGPEVCCKSDTQFKVSATYDAAPTISNLKPFCYVSVEYKTFFICGGKRFLRGPS